MTVYINPYHRREAYCVRQGRYAMEDSEQIVLDENQLAAEIGQSAASR